MNQQRKELLLAVYADISRLYSSAVSHFLTLIVAWLAFVYAFKTIRLDILALIIISVVLGAMGFYSWFRILNFGRILYQLEGILNIVEFKYEELFSFSFMKWLFLRKNLNSFTKGEIMVSFMLLIFYTSTILWILS